MAESGEFPLPGEQGSLLETEPASWPEAVAATGDSAVDNVLVGLGQLPDLPTEAHPALYQRLHDDLLAELDSSPDHASS
ncbi:hypothetical protein FHU41_000057 [Psychromicrobium silvestre]|uniref:Uncharacterized protein n=1 Tax=Psychromicrobium silvestre TaxID=1645614 RepID=A0A7Y9LQQ5_9MICC|nr:hypothetical protein [Psychromicrobium silvestre]NYE93836.1 hypothetical protein [Psychromicrobium silvestre]